MARKMRQGYNDRLDESLGMRNRGKKKQSLKSRRDESKAMEKATGSAAYSGMRSDSDRMKKRKDRCMSHEMGR